MFSSMQEFRINGDTDENLKTVLKTVAALSDYKVKSYDYVNGEVFLYWTEDAGGYKFPIPATADMLTSLISELLMSSDSEVNLNAQESVDLDGSQERGWEVYIPQGLYGKSEYKSVVRNECYIIVAVKPAWTYYGK